MKKQTKGCENPRCWNQKSTATSAFCSDACRTDLATRGLTITKLRVLTPHDAACLGFQGTQLAQALRLTGPGDEFLAPVIMEQRRKAGNLRGVLPVDLDQPEDPSTQVEPGRSSPKDLEEDNESEAGIWANWGRALTRAFGSGPELADLPTMAEVNKAAQDRKAAQLKRERYLATPPEEKLTRKDKCELKHRESEAAFDRVWDTLEAEGLDPHDFL